MQLGANARGLETISVPAVRLDDLVIQYGLSELDILQIDTEGHDWRALQTLDLSKTAPKLIQFEHSHLSPSAVGSMIARLNEFGYTVYFGGHQSDSVAMRSDFLEL